MPPATDACRTPDSLDRFLAEYPGQLPDSIAVAVSGGSDSMALCLLLHEWQRKHPHTRIAALTVDHGLRPESSDEARRVQRQLVDTLMMCHEILTWQPPAGITSNIQEQARQARYDLLTAWCRENGFPLLLLGHHREDQAETFLLRLARGSGVQGLAAMAPLRQEQGIWLGRPLLDIPKSALRAHCNQQGQAWLEDPSNHNPRFSRTHMRQLLPRLEESGISAQRLADTARHLMRASNALQHYCFQHLHETVTVHPAGCYQINSKRFQQAPEDIRLRSLSWLIQRLNSLPHPPRFERLSRLEQQWKKGESFVACLGETVLKHGRQGTWLFREASACPITPWTGNGTLWDNRFQLEAPKETPENGFAVRALGAREYPAYAASLPEQWPYHAKVALPALYNIENNTIHAIFKPDSPFTGGVLTMLPYIL